MRQYLATVAAVDEVVGRVLDYLEANGLSKNTVVVYTPDQGFYLGEHGWFDKRFIYDESVGNPFLIQYPVHNHPEPGVREPNRNLHTRNTLRPPSLLVVPARTLRTHLPHR